LDQEQSDHFNESAKSDIEEIAKENINDNLLSKLIGIEEEDP
jgi:hypothetical protein